MPSGHHNNTPWNDDEKAAAAVLFHANRTATEAAKDFSAEYRPMTRNGMIGIWHRLGLRRGHKLAENGKQKRLRTEINKNGSDMNIVNALTRKLSKYPLPVEPYQDEPISKSKAKQFKHRCGLFDLTNTSCRWPVGDPGTADFFFCGAPEAALDQSRPYCPAHHAIAFRSFNPRIRE